MSSPSPAQLDKESINCGVIHIIESLPPEEMAHFSRRTGSHLFDMLQPIGIARNIEVRYHAVEDVDSFFRLLDEIAADIQLEGRRPWIHIESHGEARVPGQTTATTGFFLGERQYVPWRALVPRIERINILTNLNLFIFMAACNGADMATVVRPLDRAPFRVCLGPLDEVDYPDLETATMQFYQALFETLNLNAALKRLNDAMSECRVTFLPTPANVFFVSVMKGYFEEFCDHDRLVERFEHSIRHVGPISNHRRGELFRYFSDHRGMFLDARERFFFSDLDRANTRRFPARFEECWPTDRPLPPMLPVELQVHFRMLRKERLFFEQPLFFEKAQLRL